MQQAAGFGPAASGGSIMRIPINQRDEGVASAHRRMFCIGMGSLFAAAGLADATGAAASPFPQTIRHALGQTKIANPPKRIITLGWNSEDIVLALGVIPIAIERRGLFDSGIFPWNEPLMGATEPVLLQPEMLDFEQIALLRPDLIIVLAAYSSFSTVTYDRLARIAPTVVHQSAAGQTPWRAQTAFISNVLGRTDVAAEKVLFTERFLAALKANHPEVAGKNFVFGTYSSGDSNLGLYLSTDPRMEILQQLGLKIAPGIEGMTATNKGKWRTAISLERIDELDADVFILGYGREIQQSVESNNLLQQVPAIRQRRCVYLDNPELVWASSALSVLSIPYAFGSFFQRIVDVFESERG